MTVEEEIINKARQVVEDMFPYTNRISMPLGEQASMERKRTLIAFGFEMGAEWMRLRQNKND